MFHLLVLAAVLTVCAAVDDVKPAASAVHMGRQGGDHLHDDGYQYSRLRDDPLRERYDDNKKYVYGDRHNDGDYKGPVILRTSNPHDSHGNTPDITRQNRIIADVYSPDYYQPTWILDYRYMKTGGRDYTRGPGGQILILPKNIRTNEQKEFRDFDSLLEHLRLKNIANHNDMRNHDKVQYNRGRH